MMLTFTIVSVLAQAKPLPPPPLVDAGGEVVQVVETPAPFSNHMRFGGGSFQGANGFYNGDANLNVGLLGAYMRLGVQASERLGIEIEGAAATSVFLSTYRGALWGTFTANDYVTLGAGLAAGTNSAYKPGIFGPSRTYSHDYLAVVERIDFHFISGRTGTGGRKAFTLGLELEQGPQDDSANGQGVGIGAYVTMGYAFW